MPLLLKDVKKDSNLKQLIPFITAGDPSLAVTKKLILTLEKGGAGLPGADLIELGIPFSDPMADGPVIQKASERALAKGVSLRKVIQLVKEVREVTRIPLLLMGYYNPILAYGLKQYAQDAKEAGINATLVVDLPPEESAELDRELKKVKIPLIYLLTPTSDEERIRLVAKRARGFIYFVSMTGVTGAKLSAEKEINEKIKEIRKFSKLPIVIGFGISKPDQAARMARLADGVVIGSALVSLIHQKRKSNLLPAVERFVGQMRKAIS